MQNIKNLAYRFLAEAQLKELSISVSTLKEALRKQNIYLFKYSELNAIKDFVPATAYNGILQTMEENEAIAVSTDNLSIIMYSDDLPHSRKIQKIYHELGHIIAEHKRSKQFMFVPNEEQEQEADAFSLYVMAPPCIMKEIGVSSAEDISFLTGLNSEHAETVLSSIRKYKGNSALNIEKILLHQFEHFISANKLSKPPVKKIITTGAVIALVCALSFLLVHSNTPTSAPTNSTTVHNFAPSPIPITEDANEIPTIKQSAATVWKAKTGNIYHTDPDCYHIPPSAYTMDLDDALAAGYRECKDCAK